MNLKTGAPKVKLSADMQGRGSLASRQNVCSVKTQKVPLMNSLHRTRSLFGRALALTAMLLLLNCCSSLAQLLNSANSFTNSVFFTNTIALDGDISDFFFTNGVSIGLPKPGVCVSVDNALTNNTIFGVANSEGLGPEGFASEPNNLNVQQDKTSKHPSGFNQRRIIAAYNPNSNGGTIFIG